MKKRYFAVLGVSLLLVQPAMAVDGDAVVGGAVGGGVGAAIGSELGGREGAIIGGAIGGATGAAVATAGDDDQKARRETVEPTRVMYVEPPRRHVPPGHARGHYKQKKRKHW